MWPEIEDSQWVILYAQKIFVNPAAPIIVVVVFRLLILEWEVIMVEFPSYREVKQVNHGLFLRKIK